MLRFKIGISFFCIFFCTHIQAQYKDFSLTDQGDTVNVIDNKGLKQGKWIVHVDELRGEPGYEEEGEFKDGKKEGVWRRYTLTNDLTAIENYRFGGKDGVQQYFTFLGDPVREESWRAYNPYAPYDTIPVYGSGNNEIISYKVVKAEPYSVKHGVWKFYDSQTGRIVKTETYDRNKLETLDKPEPQEEVAKENSKPKEKVKPKEVLEFEKKNSRKKKTKVIDGSTRM